MIIKILIILLPIHTVYYILLLLYYIMIYTHICCYHRCTYIYISSILPLLLLLLFLYNYDLNLPIINSMMIIMGEDRCTPETQVLWSSTPGILNFRSRRISPPCRYAKHTIQTHGPPRHATQARAFYVALSS